MLREVTAILDQLSEVVDLILIGIAFYLATLILPSGQNFTPNTWQIYFLIFLVYMLFWIIGSKVFQVYVSRRAISLGQEGRQMLKSHGFALAAALIIPVIGVGDVAQNYFPFYLSAYAILLTLVTHLLVRVSLEFWRSMGRNKRYVLILGGGQAAERYLTAVQKNPQSGYEVIGYLAKQRSEALAIPYYGQYSDLEQVLALKVVDLTVATEEMATTGVQAALDLLAVMGKPILLMLDNLVPVGKLSKPMDFGGLPMIAYESSLRRPWDVVLKRLMDVILATAGLIMLSPLMLGTALVIKLTSTGPVFFSQSRVGVNGRIFSCYKFRSMVVNAEELKVELAHLNEMSGPVFKIKDDPRVTPVGNFIRKTSIDELPQLWNVLKGDMSLVGPRPPLPEEVDLYNPKHRKRLSVRPGITCIWQISGRSDVDFEQWMAMDASYVDKWSLWLDISILAKTVPAVVLRRGAS